MREVIGRTTLEAALTLGKSQVAADATKLTQDTLDNYKAGIQVQDVTLQTASFPQEVVAAARRCRRRPGRSGKHAQQSRNLHQQTAARCARQGRRHPAGRGSLQGAGGGTGARPGGRASSRYHEQYKQAEDVTRKRIYLETMEKSSRAPAK